MEEKVHVSESYHFANMHWQKSGETDRNGLQEYLATEGRAALYVRNNVHMGACAHSGGSKLAPGPKVCSSR